MGGANGLLHSGVVGLLSYLCVLDYRYFKAHGSEEVKGEEGV